MKLLHIGLGKCGSTLLQQEIFPKIANFKQIQYINIIEKLNLTKSKIDFHILENKINFEKELPDEFILSYEGLFAHRWEFSRVLKSFEYIKKNFSHDTVILIILRNPYDLLNSIYCQSIQKAKIVKPENFFYIEKNEAVRKNNKFNLYQFDYNNLISLYKSYFKKVFVTRYEDLDNYIFLKEIFNLNDDFIDKLKMSKKRLHNRSISRAGIKTHLFLNKFINLEQNQKLMYDFIEHNSNFMYKIRNKILSQLILRNFFQNKFDRFLPYRKYYFNKDFIPIDINEMILNYNKMKL